MTTATGAPAGPAAVPSSMPMASCPHAGFGALDQDIFTQQWVLALLVGEVLGERHFVGEDGNEGLAES